MGKAKIRPPVESTPLNPHQYTLWSLLIRISRFITQVRDAVISEMISKSIWLS